MFVAVVFLVQSTLSSWIPYKGAYHGPLAKPVVLPSGFLADTPEVAAVKSAHLTLAHGYGYSGAYAPAVPAAPTVSAVDDGSYKGEGEDDGSYKGEAAYAAVRPISEDVLPYDDGSYKGEYGYASVVPAVPAKAPEDDGSYKGDGEDDGSYKGEAAYAPAAPAAPAVTPAAPKAYDDGSYKGEYGYASVLPAAPVVGKYYKGVYGYASVEPIIPVASYFPYSYVPVVPVAPKAPVYDDGSYKPYLYEKKHY